MARGQAQELMPMVDRVLAAAGIHPTHLSAVAVTRGPGAFTGLRIALASARGFALALGVPCVGVTTLEVVAAAVPQFERADATVLACVESKREDLYVQLFSSALVPICEPLACDAAALTSLLATGERLILVGDGAPRALDMLAGANVDARLSSADPLPDPRRIAEIAAARLRSLDPRAPLDAPEPLYLRPPDAKLPKAQGRLRE
jgi:tRNA threonylcarbamoyladenosine biosynthesis protein TsaB